MTVGKMLLNSLKVRSEKSVGLNNLSLEHTASEMI